MATQADDRVRPEPDRSQAVDAKAQRAPPQHAARRRQHRWAWGLALSLAGWLALVWWLPWPTGLSAAATAIGVVVWMMLAGWALVWPIVQDRMLAADRVRAERLFDSLYRAARAIEQSPERATDHLAGLLGEIFEPTDIEHHARALAQVQLGPDGQTLSVPVLRPDGEPTRRQDIRMLLLRQARRGGRPFTEQDRHLTERLLEQLGRAVAYDRAVEHGRTEERLRIAQDLHDDIGARLLTLMYKAPNIEIEEYIRHTLQDLKTLTRGLAAANQLLSHAAAEWKSDISQRLHPTGCVLRWSFSADRELTLSVVQWSGLTRVLRELVNNIISHAQASLVEISLQLDHSMLTLTVQDDGCGETPANWSHGLGLGGVRKRVKLLAGQVLWQEASPRGIRCLVQVPLPLDLATPPSPASPQPKKPAAADGQALGAADE